MDPRLRRSWRVAEAKERFSEVLRQAAKAPQLIFNRDRLVAVVLAPSTLEEIESWKRERDQANLADAFAELRRLCSEESYALEPPPRVNRANAFAEDLDDVSG